MSGPYDIVIYHGRKLDRFSMQRMQDAERDLGYDLSIVQGSYNRGVGASAGTHDRGGVVDLLEWDWQNKCRELRKAGWAAWHRPAIPGLWGGHIHAVQYDNKRLSPSAQRQVTQYYNHTDGLASYGWDSQWRPDPLPHFTFRRKPKRPKVNLTHLQGAYKRPGGRTYNPWGVKAVRLWVKHLRKEGYTVKGFNWKLGWFGRHVQRATAKLSKNRDLPYGEKGWPSWQGAKEIGLRPYRVKRERRPNRKRTSRKHRN